MLSEEQLEALKLQYQKIAVISYNGHQIVFRRPTRLQCGEYRREREDPQARADAVEHLAQKALVAFDGEMDANRARTTYTASFLEEFPLFANYPPVMAALSYLTGMVEEEDASDLGKGVRVLSARRPSTPEVSPNGSVTVPGLPPS